jgi:hypothetical protein
MNRAKIIASLFLAVCAVLFINIYIHFTEAASRHGFAEFVKPKYDSGMQTEFIKPIYKLGDIYETIFLND